jgi:hypothetical protein
MPSGGTGVFEASLAGLRRLSELGYWGPASELVLDLVYDPRGPSLPPSQGRMLPESYGIRFNRLQALANLPIGRFGSTLLSQGRFHPYLAVLKGAHREENTAAVMCRELVSVAWCGFLCDCDFNQQLGLPLGSTLVPGASAQARFGAVSFVHHFGASLNRHLHYHCCILDGLFDPLQAGGGQFRHASALVPEEVAMIEESGAPPRAALVLPPTAALSR